jgi:hypothetical protein
MGMCCCGTSCGCGCASCACGGGRFVTTGTFLTGSIPASSAWSTDQAAQYERKHDADQCCKHDDKTAHTPKAVRKEGGLWQRVESDLKKI